MTVSYRVLALRSKGVKRRTASSDYIVENTTATPWPHEETALDIDKPHQNINLLPMREEDHYIQRQPEWAIPKNL